MKSNPSVHNMDTLDKEIYRLQVHKMQLEKKLDRELDYLREHYISMAAKSVFAARPVHKEGEGVIARMAAGKLGRVLDKVVDHLLDRSADGIERIIDRVFHKKTD